MKKDMLVHLEDIVASCDRIARYLDDVDQAGFENDDELQDAVVRRLEIIGEATKRLPQEFREQHAHLPWKEAAGMRDFLIHAYDDVDMSQVWRTAIKVVPEFKEGVTQLVSGYGEQ